MKAPQVPAPTDLVEFARWALGSVTVNTRRGWYAEWLVRNAVGDPATRRGEWAPADIITPDLQVEVKCTGLVQDWAPSRGPDGRPRPPSPPGFGRLVTRRWTGVGNEFTEPRVVANVYVFAVHTCVDRAQYNVSDAGQWRFHVVSGWTVQRWRQNSIRLTVLRSRVPECSLVELSALIRSRAQAPEGADRFDWSRFLSGHELTDS